MPHLDEPVQANNEELRCPRCGKRINAEMTVCPACAYELVPHKPRIGCKYCGSRIPADSVKCPRCGKNPQVERIPPIVPRIAAIAVGVLLVVCIGWVIFRAATTNVLGRTLGLDRTPTAPVQLVQVIYVVASPVPPTPTLTRTATPTPIITPSPTRKGARPAPTVVKTTPVAPSSFYPAVPLQAPLNTTVYVGANANIVLEWQSVAPNGLRENEWYEIKVNFTARDGTPGERKSYSKETRWVVANNLYTEIASDARTFMWIVTVVRVDGIDPLSTTNRTPISIGGTTRTFIWN